MPLPNLGAAPSSSTTPAFFTPASGASLDISSHGRSQGHCRTSPIDLQRPRTGSSQEQRGLPADLPPKADDLLKPTLIIKAHPSTLTSKPSVLYPIMLLPRESLPLTSLDLSHPHGDIWPSRFYESRRKMLELEERLGCNVLIARAELSKAVYAIERETTKPGLYVLCKLGAWVDLKKLADEASLVCSQRLKFARPQNGVKNSDSGLPITTPNLYKQNKKKRLAIEEIQSLVKRKRARSESVLACKDDNEHNQNQLPVRESERSVADENTPTRDAQPVPATEELVEHTKEDIFASTRVQYLDMLYHSMGSVAYFAKGPLSRARAAFHLDEDSNLDMRDLINFLQSLVMTTAVVDKKYRDTIPEALGKFKTFIEDSDNDSGKPVKKRQKIKPGKNGLYPTEEEHIRRWWNTHKSQRSGNDGQLARPEEVRYHISCLRRRETQLQMILILEILALEPLARSLDNGESQLPVTLESAPGPALRKATEQTLKKRSKHNFPLLLDVHADRLCIWQSTTLDDMRALGESQACDIASAAPSSERPNADPLEEFCIDVILPFFAARLPDICDSINRKLGGPVVQPSPKVPRAKPQPMPLPKSKPGAPARRSVAAKRNPEQTLERALSNERMRRSVSRGPPDALARMRSASNTTIPGLKKEGSEPLMGTISRASNTDLRDKGPSSSLREKPANLFSRSMNSTSGRINEEVKAQKKAMMEAELKNAISALKRPNRALVGQDIVAEQAKRTRAKARKFGMGRVGASAQSQVQVKATPANNRFVDVMAAETARQTNYTLQGMVVNEEMDQLVPSSSSVIAASAVKRSGTFLFGGRSTSVSATPPATHKTRARGGDIGYSSPSPLLARKAGSASQEFHSAMPGPDSALRPDVDGYVEFSNASSPIWSALFETPITIREMQAANDGRHDT